MSPKYLCLIRPRCIRTGLTVTVSFMFAYILFQCALLVLNSVSTVSSPNPRNNQLALLGPPSKSHRVPLGYYYSGKDFAPKPFVAQSKQLAKNVHPDTPNSAAIGTVDESNKKNKRTQTKPPGIMQSLAKSVKHCKRTSPYYDTSSMRSHVETLQSTMSRTLTLLNNFSGNRGAGEKLTSSNIVPHVCKVNQTQLLVVIQSDLRNSSQRNRIRKSWATLDYFSFDASSSGPETAPSKVDYLFLVDFVYNTNVSAQELDVFMLEIEREQDVLPIQLTPARKRLLHGYLAAGEFVLTRCENRLRYVAFLTDDLMPNIPLLGSFATAQNPATGPDSKPDPMYCFVVENENPVRPKKKKTNNNNKKKKEEEQVVEQTGKVTVTQSEWPKKVFPTYCDMRLGGFLLSVQSLKLWSACARVHRPFEKLPPIYLTGILTEAAGVPMQRYWTTYGDPVPLLPSLGSGARAGQHLFFTQTQHQPLWVWKSVFQAILGEALR